MVTPSDTESIQVEVLPGRYLMPATAQKLLSEIYGNGGIVRMTIHGPNLPRSVPYGPGKGAPIAENRDLLIEIGGQAFELFVRLAQSVDGIFAPQHSRHLSQDFPRQDGLHGRVDPAHPAMAEGWMISRLHARHVIHTAAPAAGPVGAVQPGAVRARPLGVGQQGRENLRQAGAVAKPVAEPRYTNAAPRWQSSKYKLQ